MGTGSINRRIANELWLEFYLKRGWWWLPVLTDSMGPMIRPGDQVLVSKVEVEEIRFGDIVLFTRNGDLIVHRVLNKRRTANGLLFSEKGDMSYSFGYVEGDKVMGRINVVKGRGRILGLNSPPSRLANLVLSAWLYYTAISLNILKFSKSGTLRWAGRLLYGLVMVTSNILVRSCFIIWYPSGLFARKNGARS